jgi:hypothetical protein
MLLVLLVLVVVAVALTLPAAGGGLARLRRRFAKRRAFSARAGALDVPDPGRERRAEQRARELLRSCVNAEEWAMYRDLGFIRVWGAQAGSPGSGEERQAAYAYLIYPQKPIVAYVPETRQLLSEYCVEFPELSGEPRPARLPDSDDVLAKWMALTGDERRLVADANMHLPGRQIDPARVRRDIWRLGEWERQRAGQGRIASHR